MDVFDGSAGTPTLAQLSAYDEVVAFSDCAWSDATTLGNNLAAYEDAGGVVFAANFSWYGGGQSIGGSWMTSYSPYQNSGTVNFSTGTLGTYNAGSPLMTGVSSLSSYYRETLALASGATEVAKWNDGTSAIAVKGRAAATSGYIGDSSGQYSGDWARLIVNAGYSLTCTADHFAVSAPALATAGKQFSFTVTAEGSGNCVAHLYAGTVHFTSSDGSATLPADASLTNGVGTFQATLASTGNQTVSATDTVSSSITGTSSTIAVVPPGLKILIVEADCSNSEASLQASLAAQSGVAQVDVFDASAGTPTLAQLSLYDEVVAFSDCAWSDPTTLGNNLADYEDAGGVVFAANFDWYGGSQSIGGRWMSGGYSPYQGPGTVNFSTGTLGTYDAGSPLMIGVNSLSSVYRETLALASGATEVAKWNDGTSAIAVKGRAVATSGYFGDYSGNYSGDWAKLIVNAGNLFTCTADHFAVSAPALATAGKQLSFTVTAEGFGNCPATGYAGTVHFTSSDGSATLPADATLTNGVGTFHATLSSTGNQTVSATDTISSSITGTSGTIAVVPPGLKILIVQADCSSSEASLQALLAAQSGVAKVDVFDASAGTPTLAQLSLYDEVVAFSDCGWSDATTLGNNLADYEDAGGVVFAANFDWYGGSQSIGGRWVSGGYSPYQGPGTVNFSTGTLGTYDAGSPLMIGVNSLSSVYRETLALASGATEVAKWNDGTSAIAVKGRAVATSGYFGDSAGNYSGDWARLIVNAGNFFTCTADHLAVSAPGSATAGSQFSVTVTAEGFGNCPALGYAGTVHFTSSDGSATLPANTSLTNGVGTFHATLRTAGNQTVSATDTVTSSITGTSGTIAVSPAAATHFVVSAPGSATAGSQFSFTVTALDQFNNTATGYAGTVHFTSSDGAATLPANASLTNGVGTFHATLRTAGNRTVSATDTLSPSITGTSGTIAVSPAAATHFLVSAPGSATAGGQFSFTVTALDQFGNTATGYAGTVHFTSSDGSATLPANAALTNGVGTFHATLRTAGNQTISATDTVHSSITGTSGTIAVSPAAATHFAVSAPSSATAGSQFSVTVTALDQFDNTATGYAGTVHFTSSDGSATLPGNASLTNGAGTFHATLQTAGSQTVSATDTLHSAITGTSATIAVSPAAATHFLVSAPGSATAGSQFSFTVTALDQFNNTATGYAGTVHFTSSDGSATLPGDASLTNGAGTFDATLQTAGSQTVSATDTVDSSVTGTSGTIAVSPGSATHFAVSAPGSATAGSQFSFTVTALDQFNNTATGYAGTVHFTSSDGSASLPADASLTNGAGTFDATLRTAGSQTISATDSVDSSVTGTSGTIAVSALSPVLRGHTAYVVKGRAGIKLACKPAAACPGQLEIVAVAKRRGALERKLVVVARGSYSIAAGKTVTLRVRLTRKGLALLEADHGRLRSTLELTPTGGTTTTTSLTLKTKH